MSQRGANCLSCISFYSYIKPQLPRPFQTLSFVVYRSIPTSNRNSASDAVCYLELYIVLFLHQTATWCIVGCHAPKLYIVLFLHQTATYCQPLWCLLSLYIVLFLHQTATLIRCHYIRCRCISFYSYIKPQPYSQNCP